MLLPSVVYKRVAVVFVVVFGLCAMVGAGNFGVVGWAKTDQAVIAPAITTEGAGAFIFQRSAPDDLAPAVLDPGDLVVLAFNSDGVDDFALIALANIPGGSRFFISDNAWSTAANNLIQEGGSPSPNRQIQFDVAAAGIPIGTVIKFDQSGANVVLTNPALGTLTMVARFPVDPLPGSGKLSFGTVGDQILIYKTAGDTVNGTVTMISGFNPSVDTSTGFYTLTNGWQVGIVPQTGQTAATSASNAPAGLVVFNGANASTATALGLGSFPVTGGLTGQDNYRFNGNCAQPDKAAYLTAINNPANWVADDVTPYDLSTVCPGGATSPEINVQGNGANIPDGSVTPLAADHTIFGSTAVTGGTLTRTFTIQNSGTANLSVTGITFSGGNSGDFSVSGISFPATIAPSGSTTFVVTFDPSAAGLRSTTVNIANNDSSENPYDFAIQGGAYVVVPPTGTAPPLQWSSTVQNTNAGTTRVVGSTNSGDVIAGSRINSGAASDLRIARHVGGTGVVSWTRDITNGTNDEIADMIVDPANGDAYICANATVGANSTDWFVIKVNGADGTVAWTRTHNGTLGTGADSCFDIARTSDGNVVAAGLSFSTPSGLNFARVEKINASTGASIWAYVSPTSSSQFSGIATDNAGNTYAVGVTTGATQDGLTVKLNSSGASSWVTTFNGTANLSDSLSQVVVDPSGNPVVGGTTRISDVPVTDSDGIVIKYAAATGAETWRRLITGTALASESINNLVTDAGGDLYAAGSIRNLSTSDRDAYVARITGSTGALAWITTKFGSGPNSDDRYQNVRAVGTDVYAVGNLDGANRDIIASRFAAASGAEVWSATYNGTGNGADDEFSNKHVMTVIGTDAIAIGGQTVDVSTNTFGIVLKYAVSTDLAVTKSDTVAGTTPFGSTWNWRLDVATSASGPATFASGQVIVKDDLPNTNVGYSAPSLSNQVGLSGTGTVSCAIASSTLTCTASGGTVTIAASGGFRVTTTSTPTALGTFGNPRAAGVCSVDPDLNIGETNEANNACTGSVTVTKANTTTSVTSSQNPSLTGQSVTFTATVGIVAPGSGTLTGSVDFLDGATVICNDVPLSASIQCTTSGLSAANHTITAQYSGDGNFNASSGVVTGGQTVTNTATWDGSASSDWNTAANWNVNVVPGATNSINLPSSGVTNQPNLSATNTAVADLAVGANRTLTIGGGRTLTVNGVLTMNGLNIDATAGLLEIGGAGSIVRTSGVVLGPMRKVVTSAPIASNASVAPESPAFVFVYPVGTSTGFSPLSANFTAGSGSLTVSANNGTAPSTPALNDATTLDRYWQLTETGDITASLTFSYLDPDVDGNEATYRLIRSAAGSPPIRFPNGCPGSPCVDAAANTMFANPVSSFNNFWTAGEPLVPTAANVEIAGRVFDSSGRAIAYAIVVMTDSSGNARQARTNAFGYYSFTGIESGRDYVFDVASKGHTFQSRVVNVIDNVTDMDFIAEP